MENFCETPGHEERPGPYTIDGRRACRSCRNKHVRESDPNYVPKKPGRRPDPTRPNSRYNPESRHHRGGSIQCGNGHKWVEGSYRVRTDGKKVCLLCIAERKGEYCPAGLHLRSEEENQFGNCRACQRTRMVAQRLKDKYGLTVEKLQEMIEDQDGRCALCREDFVLDSHNGVCVDHDHNCCKGEHTCGKCIRGILCGDCNKNLHDEIEWHLRAIAYLTAYQLARKLART
jgi:hypothetical protein